MGLLSSGSVLEDHHIGADEEAGTSPGDRRFETATASSGVNLIAHRVGESVNQPGAGRMHSS